MEHQALQEAAGVHLLAHLAVDFFVDPGHRQQHLGAHFQKIPGHGLQAFGVVDANPAVQHEVVAAGPFKDVGQRQQAQDPLAGLGLQDLEADQHIGGDVAVAEHGALGVAGGARGVDDGQQIPGPDAPAALPDLGPAGLPERAPALQIAPGQEPAARDLGDLAFEEHGGFQVRQLRPEAEDLFQLPGGGAHQPAGAAVLEDVGGLGQVQAGVDGHRNDAGDGAGIIRHRPFRPVLRQDAQAIPAAQAGILQGQGQALHLGLQFPVGKRVVGSFFPIGQGVREVKVQGCIKKFWDGLDQVKLQSNDERWHGSRVLKREFRG